MSLGWGPGPPDFGWLGKVVHLQSESEGRSKERKR